ncbi:PREDICTED: glutamate--cysteine ligase, chloroplastic-like [Camelina sativa]|uniref:Glutamate--cysteine ligase, chloroplastic-like n=1 Tax=Camelina sativa TaxID=90675 RepID=A0ABM0U3N9_CAMSA|nr:PREDICTED: glutamate--cysteine ligase, chloroplastic-like [Camelina sativa]
MNHQSDSVESPAPLEEPEDTENPPRNIWPPPTVICHYMPGLKYHSGYQFSLGFKQVPIAGLKTMFRGGPLKHVAEDVLKLAMDGLERRGYNETGFLNPIAEVVRTGVTPAHKLLELYNGEWGQNIDHVFEELRY